MFITKHNLIYRIYAHTIVLILSLKLLAIVNLDKKRTQKVAKLYLDRSESYLL